MRKILLSLFFIIFSTNQIFGLTKSEIRTRIRRLSRDAQANTSERYWSDTILERRMDTAQLKIVKETLCLSTYSYSPSVANQSEYNLPSDLLVLNSVNYSTSTNSAGAYKRLEFTTRRKLKEDIPSWESTSAGTPTQYFVEGMKVTLYPKPNSSSYHIRFNYVPKPILLSNLGDSGNPFVVGATTYTYLEPYHELIVDYVVLLNKLEEGSPEANYYTTKFMNGISIMIEELNATPDRAGQIQYSPAR